MGLLRFLFVRAQGAGWKKYFLVCFRFLIASHNMSVFVMPKCISAVAL